MATKYAPYIFLACVGSSLLSSFGYFYATREEPSLGPSPGPTSDVIVITDEGSTFETETSGTETYIAMPRQQKCRGRESDPSWCGAITPTTEMNYVFDPVGGSVGTNGEFETTFNFETNMCADGTQNCLYEEKFDETRKLIGITNAQGDDFIQKFIDDIYSGTVDFNVTRVLGGSEGEGPQNLKDYMKKMITFDTTTGKLSMNVPGRTPPTIEVIPGNGRDGVNDDGQMKMAVGQMIVFIIFYYYSNDLPKPTIKLNITSQETLGKVYQDFVAAKVANAADAVANTDGGGIASA
jgi:hypothetical protein|tara:strand:+ start:7631 stop:8512 length:882 start_codon:yes stop_codon:yes gene_type:complete